MDTDKPPIPSADWLKWLGERRDGFLVGGAVLYGLGYLVWSYNAWRNHLGQLPAIEFQYLMSGLIPGAIIGIAWAAIIFFSNMHDKTIALFEKHRSLRWIIPPYNAHRSADHFITSPRHRFPSPRMAQTQVILARAGRWPS